MFYVVEGSGEVRIGSETFPIRAGDIIACPPGGQDTAHQI
ncbi:MAG TPA: cupin domain-containing protein, partial [Burkholderiales bacterium]|nr:cupin domain-containing protein [Burkholderiales bacterium]